MALEAKRATRRRCRLRRESRQALGAAAALACLALWTSPAAAQGFAGDAAERIEQSVDEGAAGLKRRADELWPLGELIDRIHLSASYLGAHWHPRDGAQIAAQNLETWDSRVFGELDVLRPLVIREQPVVNHVGVVFEWEFYRLRREVNDYGDFYLDVQGLAGSPWLNLQFGRFQLPVGENYLRFGKAVRNNPFLSNTVGGTWWWDEGLRIHGSDGRGRLGYVASLTSGESERNFDFDGDGQATLKLYGKPLPWLHLSTSAAWTPSTGSQLEPAKTSLWLGETWGRAFGSGARGPNFQDGRVVADAPGRIDQTLFLGADIVASHPRGARLWVGYGTYAIDAKGPSFYDRRLHSWLAELVLEGRLLTPELRHVHVALRAAGIGTYRGGEGYLLDVRYTGRYGYNMRSLEAYSVALGWKFTRWLDLRFEYTLQNVALVKGMHSVLGRRAAAADYWGAAIGLSL